MKEVDLTEPISREMANRLLQNKDLQDKCAKSGVDLGLIVNNLQLTLDERWANHRKYLEMALAFKNAT